MAHQTMVAKSGAPAASFPARVDLPALSDDQRRRIRIGMTANLAVVDDDHALRAAGD
ncbi:hypothetical protein ACHMW5_03255 [Azospirillum melinis]|uniref:hypothetical protein n=1 Tax=Azospirillum melinis TaxID=328839 RepID=UPI0037575B0B